MKRTIVIEKIEGEEYSETVLYSIRFSDEEDSEYTKFYKKFENNKLVQWDFDVIDQRITKITKEGAGDEHFREEGGAVKALPFETSKLRLYCYRLTEKILIIGNGGLKPKNPDKDKNKLIDFPELLLYAETLRVVGKILQKDIDSGLVAINRKNELEDLEPINIEIEK
ncbi:MAG: hypothetical protein ACLQQ4_07105 [Bacteroidia bacterium]